MKNFDKDFQEFDKSFNRTQKLIWIGWIISTVLGLGVLGFIIWVVIMVMRYFGVI